MSEAAREGDADELSARRSARDELAIAAVEERAVSSQTLGYAVRDFVMCSLPLRRPRASSYRRTNGDYVLEIHGSPVYGLPHGQDRLLTIWLATAFFAAGRPADNVIRFRCASDILRAFALDTSGGDKLARLRERIYRVFHATFFLTAPSTVKTRAGSERRIAKHSYRLMSSLEMNLTEEHRRHANQYNLWSDRIELDPRFADDLRAGGRVPIDLETVRALKEAPGILDLYTWQAWRSFRMERDREAPTSIPVFGEGGLVSHLGCDIASPRKMRQTLRRWQSEIRQVWQACPNFFDHDCDRFFINPGNAIATSSKIPELPGVSSSPPPMRETAGGAGSSQLVLVRDDADLP